MGVFDELKARGLIAQTTDEDKIRDLLNNGKISFYTGFDPTADSLTAGHFLQIVVMRHLQLAGHRPIVLIGDGTTMVGDPTGKTEMRKMLSRETILNNAQNFKKQLSRFIDFSDGKALMVNNGDWLMPLNYIAFLREVGVHFSVNRMLTFECFKTRLERGLSFIEFNYMLMQSYDFLHLFRKYGCVMQCGGDDQWANILGGTELIRRSEGKDSYGITFTLLTTSDGRKMGKTEKGAIWLDPAKTTPYEFFQYWRNVDDNDVIRVMKMLTFIPLDEIKQYESLSGSALNPVKERLAYELTSMVHGKDEADSALKAAKSLFSASEDMSDVPSTELSSSDLSGGAISVADLLLKVKLVPSKGEGRRLIEQGGICVNGEKVSDPAQSLSADLLSGDGILIKKGKKTYHKVFIKHSI